MFVSVQLSDRTHLLTTTYIHKKMTLGFIFFMLFVYEAFISTTCNADNSNVKYDHTIFVFTAENKNLPH